VGAIPLYSNELRNVELVHMWGIWNREIDKPTE
jgi:hypothetical protein